MTVTITGDKELVKKFRRMAKDIQDTNDVLKSVAEFGTERAKEFAPDFRGRLKSGIINFPKNNQTWIIQSGPVGGFTPNLAFDTGIFGFTKPMTMWARKGDPIVGIDAGGHPRTPFVPRNPEVNIGFMQKTAQLLEEEFSRRLNLRINRIVER